MNRRLVIGAAFVLGLLLVGWLIFGGGRDPSRLRNWPGREGPVVVFGDSLVEGYGAGPGEDFPSVMRGLLGAEVVNAGRSGDTSRSLLERVEDARAFEARLVVVAVGGNDILGNEAHETIGGNLERLAAALQDDGALVALVGYRFGPAYRDLRGLVEEVADRTGAWYIENPVKGIWNDRRYKADPIHLNAAGYRIEGERVAEAIRPLLED